MSVNRYMIMNELLFIECELDLTYKLLEMTHVSFPVVLGMTLFLFETRYGLE